MTPESCPSCGKELKDIQDYPRVEVKSVEILELPEKILHWSANLKRPTNKDPDLTSEINEVVNSEPFQDYLKELKEKTGETTEINNLLPQFEKGRFPWVYQIPDSAYSVSLKSREQEGKADLELWGDGPNWGSAGGPSIKRYATIARIEFKGKLLPVGNPQ